MVSHASSREVCRRAERAYKIRRINYIRQTKSVACLDCHIAYPYWVMQFDHVRGTKLFDVSGKRFGGYKSLTEEIAKCEIVCANCHANRTYQRRQNATMV